jgi:hypothetical protein
LRDGSRVFHGLPVETLPCSRTPPNPSRLTRWRRVGLAPAIKKARTLSELGFSGLNSTASFLAVYASCRPLRRRCKTRFSVSVLVLSGGSWTRWGDVEPFPAPSPGAGSAVGWLAFLGSMVLHVAIRVAREDHSPAPTDPDERDSRIRFLRRRIGFRSDMVLGGECPTVGARYAALAGLGSPAAFQTSGS